MSLRDLALRLLAPKPAQRGLHAPTEIARARRQFADLPDDFLKRGSGAIRRHALTAAEVRRAAHEAAKDLEAGEGWIFYVREGGPHLRALPTGAAGRRFILDDGTKSRHPVSLKQARVQIAAFLRARAGKRAVLHSRRL